MAWNEQTYKTRHDWREGARLGNSSAGQPSTGGYRNGLPNPLFAGDSFEFVVDHYEYFTDAESVQSNYEGGTAKLYIIWANVADAVPTELCPGTITEATPASGFFNRVTYNVPAAAISTDWAGSASVMIYEQITATGYQRTAYQTLQIIDRNGDSAATVAASVLDGNFFTKYATINPLSVAQTTLYTVPTGYKMLLDSGGFVLNSVTTASTAHTGQFGISTDTDSMYGPAVSSAVAVNDRDEILFDPDAAIVAAGVAIQYGITVAALHAAASGTAYIRGMLIPV